MRWTKGVIDAMDDGYRDGAKQGIILGVLVGLFIGWMASMVAHTLAERRRMMDEATKHGHGRYFLDAENARQWEWLPKSH